MELAFYFIFIIGVLAFGLTFRTKAQRKIERPRDLSEAQSFQRLELDDIRSESKKKFLKMANIAGYPRSFTFERFQLIRLLLPLTLGILVFTVNIPHVDVLVTYSARTKAWILIQMLLALLGGYFLPLVMVMAKSNARRTEYLMEISEFSHRLALCMTDQTDLRDIILRASRTSILLKPHLHDLATMWTKDQSEAIWNFKENVGIIEIFPLVNALMALSKAEKSEIRSVLNDQTASIDAALDTEVKRKLENAPIWISIACMIPFACGGALYVYPWMITALEQLSVSFNVFQ